MTTSAMATSSDAPLSWSPNETSALVQISRVALADIDLRSREEPGGVLRHNRPDVRGILIGRRRTRNKRRLILGDSAISLEQNLEQNNVRAQLMRLRTEHLEIAGFFRAGNELTVAPDDRRMVSEHMPDMPSVLLLTRPTAIAHNVVKLYLFEPAGVLYESGALAYRRSSPGARNVVRRVTFTRRTAAGAVFCAFAGCAAAFGCLAYFQARAHPSAPVTLGLAAETRSGQITVEWNTGSRPLSEAVRGELTIADGASTQLRALNLDQLRSGRLVYAPDTTEVRFSLAAFDRDGRVTRESVVVLGAAAAHPGG